MYSLRLKTTFDTFGTVYKNGTAIEALSGLYVDKTDIKEIQELLSLANSASQPADSADAEDVVICDSCHRDKNYCLCDAFI